MQKHQPNTSRLLPKLFQELIYLILLPLGRSMLAPDGGKAQEETAVGDDLLIGLVKGRA